MDWTEIANRYGLIGVVLLILVLNGDKIAARVGTFVPPLAKWLEARERARRKNENGQSAVLQHVIASDTRGEMTQVSMIERVLAMLDTTIDRLFEDRDATRADLKQVHEQIGKLREVVARHNDILGTHGQNVARLSDEVEGVKMETANMNGKLDSLGAWVREMQTLRREVSG